MRIIYTQLDRSRKNSVKSKKKKKCLKRNTEHKIIKSLILQLIKLDHVVKISNKLFDLFLMLKIRKLIILCPGVYLKRFFFTYFFESTQVFLLNFALTFWSVGLMPIRYLYNIVTKSIKCRKHN